MLSTRNLLNSDSPGRRRNLAKANIFSLPGAKVEHVYNFTLTEYFYDIIVVLIGGNN